MSKKGGQYIDRVSILPLEIIKRAIENAYTRKTDDDDDYDNDNDDDGNKNMIDTKKELLRPIAIAQMMPQLFLFPTADHPQNQNIIYPWKICSDNFYHT